MIKGLRCFVKNPATKGLGWKMGVLRERWCFLLSEARETEKVNIYTKCDKITDYLFNIFIYKKVNIFYEIEKVVISLVKKQYLPRLVYIQYVTRK